MEDLLGFLKPTISYKSVVVESGGGFLFHSLHIYNLKQISRSSRPLAKN